MITFLRYTTTSLAIAIFAAACGGGGGGSTTATPAVMVDNSQPVARIDSYSAVATGSVVTLDGTASSDADRDDLTYTWALTATPAGSKAALTSLTSANPSFIADLSGVYGVALSVNDGKSKSSIATVAITSNYITQQTCLATTQYGPPLDFTMGDYRVRNDQWGVVAGWVTPISAYTQCMAATQLTSNSLTAHWNWEFLPNASIHILSGYPGIIYGWNPGEPKSTNTILPMPVKNIGKLAINYEIEMTTTGQVQTFFDLYFTSGNTPSLPTMLHEVSISIRLPQYGGTKLFGSTTIAGQSYDIWTSKLAPPLANQIVFVPKKEFMSGSLRVKDYTDYLISVGLMSADEYLASIEFGTEPGGGKGDVLVKSYSIQP